VNERPSSALLAKRTTLGAFSDKMQPISEKRTTLGAFSDMPQSLSVQLHNIKTRHSTGDRLAHRCLRF